MTVISGRRSGVSKCKERKSMDKKIFRVALSALFLALSFEAQAQQQRKKSHGWAISLLVAGRRIGMRHSSKGCAN